MSDYPIQLLANIYRKTSGSSLWIADENLSASEISHLRLSDTTLICTNRVDVYSELIKQHTNTELSDFSFEKAKPNSIDTIFYRISKEKPIVHHVINRSFDLLKEGGQLIMTGYKNDGTKTYFDKTRKLFDGASSWRKEDQQSYCGTITKNTQRNSTPKFLDDKDYSTLRSIAQIGDINFHSKPGIFGWDKIDRGSKFLIDHLQEFVDQCKTPPSSLLDLGCGYGYLSIMASKLLNIPVTATDNNVTSVAICKHNMKLNQVSGKVVLDNCGSDITEKFDAVLCNPPFHQGFSVEGQLTDHFLSNCKRLLKPGGRAIFVVNCFIPLEKKAASHFSNVETLANNKSFKLICTSA